MYIYIYTERLSVQIMGIEATDKCMNMLLAPSHDGDFRDLQATHHTPVVLLEFPAQRVAINTNQTGKRRLIQFFNISRTKGRGSK
jgi:hypothetical protein